MWVDLLIVLAVIGAVYRSWGSGFVRQLCGSIGFFGGLFIGRFLEPHTVHLVHSATGRAAVTVATILGVALLCLSLGEYLGLGVKRRLVRNRFNRVDNGLGGGLTAVSALLSIWLLVSIVGSLPGTAAGLQNQLRGSHIIAELDRVLPSASSVVADLSRLIDPNGFPDVFIGSEPIPRGNVNLPALGDLATAVNADKASVLRIEGQGCGGIVSGSGFVIGDGLVATNAHVVAGIPQPYAEDSNGNHRARVVWFDSNLDFAVLKVNGLDGKPLTLDTATADSGTAAAVLGYPGGGDFNAGAAAVLDQFAASGHDIYGHGRTLRDIYAIKASVIPGNSGGPLIGRDGRVIGVIFAESTSYQHVGYALTAKAVAAEIQQAGGSQQSVSTGQCAE